MEGESDMYKEIRRVCNDEIRKRGSSWPGAVLWPAFLCVALILVSCARERVIGMNERIHHDDFEYLVTGYTVTDSIGSGESQRKAAGEYYVVTFVVENHAMRVNHDWNDSIAYVVDDRGNHYENLPELRELLKGEKPIHYSPEHRTPAGETESTQLIFDLPKNVVHPFLMVRGDLLMGDVFDGKAFTKTKIKLF
jgi:hypothetical protein